MSQLQQHQRELRQQRLKAAEAQRAVADASKKLAAKQETLRRTDSASRQKALQGEIQRLSRDRAKAEDLVAARQRDIARLEEKIVREQQQATAHAATRQRRLDQDKDESRRRLERSVSAAAAGMDEINTRIAELEAALLNQAREAVAADPVPRQHDVFLSHAGPDKQTAQQLYAELTARGLDVWFDGAELRLGESLVRQIDRGIAQARLGVVLVTDEFLQGRKWTERELGGLMSGRRRVVPVLDGVGFDDLASYSPLLADFVGLSTENEGWGEIAAQIAAALSAAAEGPVNGGNKSTSDPQDTRSGSQSIAIGISSGRRILGRDAGLVRIAEDFDAPLPAEILADFEHLS